MSRGNMNLQDSYLNQVRKDGSEVKIALTEGTLLRGTVRGFDNFTLVLQVGGMQHLIYKHAIAQIVARKMPRRDKPEPKPAEPSAQAAAPAEEKDGAQPFNRLDLSGVQAESGSPAEGAPAEAAPAETSTAGD